MSNRFLSDYYRFSSYDFLVFYNVDIIKKWGLFSFRNGFEFRRHFSFSSMGRRKNNRRPRNPDVQKSANGTTGERKGYSDIIRENVKFEKYYKMQGVIPAEEWDVFMETMKQNLPASFRITGYKGQAKALLSIIKGKYFNHLLKQKVDGPNICRPLCIPWYPNELAWQLNLSRVIIRTSEELQHLHNFLVSETETGNISRQETVSMIPPILLDVEPHHKVLDMCAAPGSKTAQIIEFLHRDDGKIPDGLVVANDIENKRCYMLVHQAKRLNSPCVIITNQDAANMPDLKIVNGEKTTNLRYDRILCDVPCSGDGTLRKTLDIWQKWNPATANNLHSLQLKLVKRGLELLEHNGKLVYSTCSLNPLENEAVISAIFQQLDGAAELLDVSASLQGLKTLPGRSHWKVVSRDLEVFDTFSDVPEKYLQQIRPSMFPPSQEIAQNIHFERCIRILPHHQDTGGFFVAVIQKTKQNLPWEVESNQEEIRKEFSRGPPKKKQRIYGYREDPFVFIEENDDDWHQIQKFYEIEGFKNTQLLCRRTEGRKRNMYFVSEPVKNIIQNNKDRVKIINTGVRSFCRSDNKDAKCTFRLTQEGVSAIMTFMSARKVAVEKEDMILLLTNDFTENAKFSESVQAKLQALESGCVVLSYTGNESADDEFTIDVCGWKGKLTLRCYVPKPERAHYLRICGFDVTDYEKREKKRFKIKIDSKEEECTSDNEESIAAADDNEDVVPIDEMNISDQSEEIKGNDLDPLDKPS